MHGMFKRQSQAMVFCIAGMALGLVAVLEIYWQLAGSE